jgi:uncharacterized protein YoxC
MHEFLKHAPSTLKVSSMSAAVAYAALVLFLAITGKRHIERVIDNYNSAQC